MNIRRTTRNAVEAFKQSKVVKFVQGDKSNPTTITRTFDLPVTRNERLGSIPSDTYDHAWSSFGQSTYTRTHSFGGSSGSNGVYRDVPVYDYNGNPKLQTVTRTLTEHPYDPKTRSVLMTGVGAAAGAAGSAIASHVLKGTALEPIALTASALVGAAGGFALGYATAAGDSVEEVWRNHDIEHPTMTGYTETVTPDTETKETNCRYETNENGQSERVCDKETIVKGYWRSYSPNISWDKVGDYDRPHLEHTNWFGPWSSTALTIAGAGAIGYGIKTALGV